MSTVGIPDTPLYWDSCTESTNGHSLRRRWWWSVRLSPTRPICSLRQRGPRHPADTTQGLLWCRGCHAGLVAVIFDTQSGVCQTRLRPVNSDNRLVSSAAGVCPWPLTHFVHRWIDQPHRGSRSLTSPVCWWHADPGLLSPWVWRSAPVYPVHLSRWCVGLDVVTNAPRIDTLLSGLAVFDYRPCTLNNF